MLQAPNNSPDLAAQPALPSRRRSLVKLLAGVVLLALLVIFSLRYGEILRTVTLKDIVLVSFISVFIVLLNGLASYRTLQLVAGKIELRDAIAVTTLSSFANALGGLPIGIVYKFYVFRKKSELAPGLIITALVYFTVLNIAALLALAGLFSHVPILLLPFAASCLLPAVPGIRRIPGLATFGWRTHAANVLLSLVTSSTMILCYLALVGNICADLACYGEQAGVVSVGLALNFMVNGQSLGGASELTMGLAGYLHGASLLQGVELAIVTRCGTLVASLILLGSLKLVYGKDNLF